MIGMIIGVAVIFLIFIIIITDGFKLKKGYTQKSDFIEKSEGKVFFEEEKIGFVIKEGYKLVAKRSIIRGNLYDNNEIYDGLFLEFINSDNESVSVYINTCNGREAFNRISMLEKKDKPHCISKDVRVSQEKIYECVRNSTKVSFMIYFDKHYIIIRYRWRFYPFGVAYNMMSQQDKNNVRKNNTDYMFAKNIMESVFVGEDTNN